MNDEFYMRLCLDEAWKYQGLSYPNPAVGCLIADGGYKILSLQAHKKAGYAHAELAAVWAAVAKKHIAFDILLGLFLNINESSSIKFSRTELEDLSRHILHLYSMANLNWQLSDDLYIYGNGDLSSRADGLGQIFRASLKARGLLVLDKLLELEPLNLSPYTPHALVLAHNFILAHASLLYNELASRADKLGLAGGIAFVSLEPCMHHGRTPPCAGLLARLGLSVVVIGSSDRHDKASGGAKFLQNAGMQIRYALKDESDTLLEPFASWQLGDGFSFAKLALSLNGVASGGIITGELSRTHVHALRSRLELLCVGGGTIRADSPILDSRLVDGRASDVLIFSKKGVDSSARLFGVANRQVYIQDSLENRAKFSMYEGAGGLLELIASGDLKGVRWLLLYQSSQFKNGSNLQASLNLEPLYLGKIANESYGWYRIN